MNFTLKGWIYTFLFFMGAMGVLVLAPEAQIRIGCYNEAAAKTSDVNACVDREKKRRDAEHWEHLNRFYKFGGSLD